MRYDTQGVFIWIPSSWLLDACHFRSSTWKCTICNRANDIFLFYFFSSRRVTFDPVTVTRFAPMEGLASTKTRRSVTVAATLAILFIGADSDLERASGYGGNVRCKNERAHFACHVG